MKLRSTNSVFLLAGCLALLCPFIVSAQEGKTPLEIEAIPKEPLRSDPDPLLSSESDFRISNKTISPVLSTKETQRDSSQVRPIKSVKPSEKTQKQEDPLSFNFLYYIIERFKLSDIIE